ncbi:MAG TPA: ABC transporter ATP-binding protein, partial [Bacillota bacterium]|nr:ABC transporter ATP-binding protein [Bacillota bacterium]
LKEEWKIYVGMFLLLLFIALIALLPAKVLGMAIDTIVSGGITPQTLLFLLGGLVLIPVVRYFSSFLYNYLMTRQAEKLAFKLRNRYLDHLFRMDSRFYEQYTKGDLISRVTNDLDGITQAATSLLEGIIFNFGMIVFAVAIMSFSISLKLTVVSITIMPIGLTILNMIRFQKRKYIKRHHEIYAEMTEKVLEAVEGMKVIRAYVQEENSLKSQYKAIDADIESWRYIVKFENWFNPLFEIIYGISYFLALAYGTYLIIHQEITLGELVTFLSYIGMLFMPIISISTIFSQLNNATVSADRFDEVMKTKPEVHDEADSKPILTFNRIDFRNVTFQYPFDKKPVIKNIDFTIQNGQTIGICGPTGAGKSTLIRQLLREFKVSEGHVFIDDIPI